MLDAISYRLMRFARFDGGVLKWVALVTMLLDHTAATFAATQSGVAFLVSIPQGPLLYEWMRAIGRTAFPIFAFLLVEGFTHTHNRRKHLLRLTVFALLSEYPFQRALFAEAAVPMRSVMMTLAVSFAMVMAIDWLWRQKLPAACRVLFSAALALAVCALLEWLRTDYGWLGGAVVLIFYLLRRWRWLAALAAYVLLGVANSTEWYAVAGILLIVCYNGKKGKQPKWLFYVFYPAHLLLLYWCRLALLGS